MGHPRRISGNAQERGAADFLLPALALKHGITLPNSPATIDPDYRGELKVILWNAGADAVPIPRGTRVAQLVFARFLAPEVEEVQALSESGRGSSGFGSTGR